MPTSFELILHVEDRKPLSLLDSLISILQIFAYRPETQVKEHEAEQPDPQIRSEYVFTYKGKPIRQDIRKSWRRVVRKAGLQGVTLHTLRHTFASQLVMAGVPLRDVQELLGHQNFATTLRYAHLSPDHVKRQVLNLPFAR